MKPKLRRFFFYALGKTEVRPFWAKDFIDAQRDAALFFKARTEFLLPVLPNEIEETSHNSYRFKRHYGITIDARKELDGVVRAGPDWDAEPSYIWLFDVLKDGKRIATFETRREAEIAAQRLSFAAS